MGFSLCRLHGPLSIKEPGTGKIKGFNLKCLSLFLSKLELSLPLNLHATKHLISISAAYYRRLSSARPLERGLYSRSAYAVLRYKPSIVQRVGAHVGTA